jgi:hypothetical protein
VRRRRLSVGVLPDDVDSLAFPTIQTYGGPDAEEVAWVEETPESGEEPEHPAPVLRLVAPEEGGHTDGEEVTTTTASDDGEQATAKTEDDEEETDGLAIAALVIAVVAATLRQVTCADWDLASRCSRRTRRFTAGALFG